LPELPVPPHFKGVVPPPPPQEGISRDNIAIIQSPYSLPALPDFERTTPSPYSPPALPDFEGAAPPPPPSQWGMNGSPAAVEPPPPLDSEMVEEADNLQNDYSAHIDDARHGSGKPTMPVHSISPAEQQYLRQKIRQVVDLNKDGKITREEYRDIQENPIKYHELLKKWQSHFSASLPSQIRNDTNGN
jgi:hypothetical protein